MLASELLHRQLGPVGALLSGKTITLLDSLLCLSLLLLLQLPWNKRRKEDNNELLERVHNNDNEFIRSPLDQLRSQGTRIATTKTSWWLISASALLLLTCFATGGRPPLVRLATALSDRPTSNSNQADDWRAPSIILSGRRNNASTPARHVVVVNQRSRWIDRLDLGAQLNGNPAQKQDTMTTIVALSEEMARRPTGGNSHQELSDNLNDAQRAEMIIKKLNCSRGHHGLPAAWEPSKKHSSGREESPFASKRKKTFPASTTKTVATETAATTTSTRRHVWQTWLSKPEPRGREIFDKIKWELRRARGTAHDQGAKGARGPMAPAVGRRANKLAQTNCAPRWTSHIAIRNKNTKNHDDADNCRQLQKTPSSVDSSGRDQSVIDEHVAVGRTGSSQLLDNAKHNNAGDADGGGSDENMKKNDNSLARQGRTRLQFSNLTAGRRRRSTLATLATLKTPSGCKQQTGCSGRSAGTMGLDSGHDRRRLIATYPHHGTRPIQLAATPATDKIGNTGRRTISKRRAEPNQLAGERKKKFSIEHPSGPSVSARRQQQQLQLATAGRQSVKSPGIECPREWCQCTWKNGKQFADCSNRGDKTLAQITSGLDPLIQVLNVSSNRLGELGELSFDSLHLNNLQRIYLASCQLERIHALAFHNLKLVVELDFSWNSLRHIPAPQMSHLSLLRRLSMRGNPLQFIDELTLSGGLAIDEMTNSSSSSPQELSNSLEWATSVESTRHESGSLLASTVSRLHESFPELVESLLLIGQSSRGTRLDEQTGALASSLKAEFGPVAIIRQAADAPAEDADEDSISVEPLDSTIGGDELQESTDAARGLSRFGQLQELDLGECQLEYIKWDTFKQLNSLKRLQLDGNKLSQLSGQLVKNFPAGLHQLSLEGNPWQCDCRLRPLKSWLIETRTPLSAPVKCAQMSGSLSSVKSDLTDVNLAQGIRAASGRHRRRTASSSRRRRRKIVQSSQPVDESVVPFDGLEIAQRHLGLTPTTDDKATTLVNRWRRSVVGTAATKPAKQVSTSSEQFLDQLALEGDFVCAPRANLAAQLSKPPDSKADSTTESGLSLLAPLQFETDINNNDENALDRQRGINSISSSLAAGPISSSLEAIRLAFDYLDPTLITRRRPRRKLSNKTSDQLEAGNGTKVTRLAGGETVAASKGPRFERIKAREDDQVTLRCSFLALPASSVHIIWMAAYPHGRKHQHHQTQRPWRLDDNQLTDESYVLLYDSRFHRTTASGLTSKGLRDEDQGQAPPAPPSEVANEFPLYESRLLVRESQSVQINSSDEQLAGWLVKDTQLVLLAAHLDDTARYKCVALNRMGRDQFEFGLRVGPRERPGSLLSADLTIPGDGKMATAGDLFAQPASSQVTGTRDQRANGLASSALTSSEPPSESLGDSPRSRNHKGPHAVTQIGRSSGPLVNSSPVVHQQQQQRSNWFRTSTFQIVIALVSALMGVVVLAFVVVCIIIYRIKPSTTEAHHAPARSLGNTDEFARPGAGSSLLLACSSPNHLSHFVGSSPFGLAPLQSSNTTTTTSVDTTQGNLILDHQLHPNAAGHLLMANPMQAVYSGIFAPNDQYSHQSPFKPTSGEQATMMTQMMKSFEQQPKAPTQQLLVTSSPSGGALPNTRTIGRLEGVELSHNNNGQFAASLSTSISTPTDSSGPADSNSASSHSSSGSRVGPMRNSTNV